MENPIMVSRENIKPSSPTRRKTYELSWLDQLVSFSLVPIVFYFPTVDDRETTTELLKRSLSVILTRFYPLAGTAMVDGQSIDCDDSGVPFTVVEFTRNKLTDLLKNPDQDLPSRLLPTEMTWADATCPDSNVMMIQVNYLSCGGVAIGALFWHNAVDASTIGNFLQAWAATARGSSREPVSPNFIAQSLFPHRETFQSPLDSILNRLTRTGKPIMKRYVFDAAAISSLKAKSDVKNSSRVEVVSALIWKCFVAASLANNNLVSLITHQVNLRRRAQPVFSSDCFGNLLGLTAATSTNVGDHELGHLIRKMRDAISKINGEYVDRMLGEDGLSGYRENLC